eukprot:143690_1
MSENSLFPDILKQVDESLTFIDCVLAQMKKEENVQKWRESHRDKAHEADLQNQKDQLLEKRIDGIIDARSHICMATITHADQLSFKWVSHFVVDDDDEKELALWIEQHNAHKISKFTNNEFIEYLHRNGSIFKSAYLRNQLDITPSLMIKTMQMFHRRKYQIDDQENFKKLTQIEAQWWHLQYTVDCIDYIEWIKKCTQYQISPLVLIKQFLKSKRLFLGYEASVEHTKRDILRARHPNRPVRRNGKHRVAKVQLRFMLDICKIPALHENWRENAELKQKQYETYYKWIIFAEFAHKTKFVKYTSERLKNGEQNIVLKEFEPQEWNQKTKDKHLIPNIIGLLSAEMCDAICSLCLSEGTIKDNVRYYKDLTVREPSTLFEKICVAKIKDAVRVYNGKYDMNLDVFNEKKIRKRNLKKRKKKRRAKAKQGKELSETEKKKPGVSPDLLFSEHVMVNGVSIIWVDTKFYFLSPHDRLGVNMVLKSVLKYVKAYGSGAIICCGFNHHFAKVIAETLVEYQLEKHAVLILDASLWSESIVDQNHNWYEFD